VSLAVACFLLNTAIPNFPEPQTQIAQMIIGSNRYTNFMSKWISFAIQIVIKMGNGLYVGVNMDIA